MNSDKYALATVGGDALLHFKHLQSAVGQTMMAAETVCLFVWRSQTHCLVRAGEDVRS